MPVTFRLPLQVQKILADKARREKISFSELVRRALHREISTARSGRRQSNSATTRGRRE